MTAKEVLATLQKLGKPNTVKTYARHGVTGPCWGVSYADIKPLVKKLGRDQALAMELWKSGVHDARIVATMIADPAVMTRKQAEAWVSDCDNYPIVDAVAGAVAQIDGALDIGVTWIDASRDWTSAAGWGVIGRQGLAGNLKPALAASLVERIEKTIHQQPNRTRHSMNSFLIGVGGTSEQLRPRVLQAAKVIGKVEVDHGQTDCMTPDATAYIAKMAARAAGKKAKKPAAAKKKAAARR